jgi:adenine-specific DNA-methyltransferase
LADGNNSALRIKNSELDIGFRCLRLDTSNMKTSSLIPAETNQSMFDMLADNIKEDRTPQDLLFQVMLDLGISLSAKITETQIAGKTVFDVADGNLLACFDKNVTSESVEAIAKRQPYYAVFRDSSMADDNVATNFDRIFDTYSSNTVRKVL